DMPGQDDDETEARPTGRGERLARAKAADRAEPAHPLDLRRLQVREHLGAPRLEDRWCRCSHGFSQAVWCGSPSADHYSLPEPACAAHALALEQRRVP